MFQLDISSIACAHAVCKGFQGTTGDVNATREIPEYQQLGIISYVLADRSIDRPQTTEGRNRVFGMLRRSLLVSIGPPVRGIFARLSVASQATHADLR